MSVCHVMPNGEVVPVPQEIVSKGRVAEQGFYDGQMARLLAEGFVPASAPVIDDSAPAAPVEE